MDLGISFLTVYALSLDNLHKRDQRELDLLFELFIQVLCLHPFTSLIILKCRDRHAQTG